MTCDAPASIHEPAFVGVDAPADLQPVGKRFQRLPGRDAVAGPEHDDVAAAQVVAAIELREPRRRALRDEVGFQAGVAERAADDLLHLAFVQVNAGTEHGAYGMPWLTPEGDAAPSALPACSASRMRWLESSITLRSSALPEPTMTCC